MKIEVGTPSEAVAKTVNLLAKHGYRATSRGMTTREFINYSISIRRPWHLPFTVRGRRLNQRLGAIEAVQLVAGQPMLELVRSNRSLADATIDPSGTAHGNYGSRVYGQLGRVIEALSFDPGSRQAVMTIFDTNRDVVPAAILDVPCTLSIQFFIRDDTLLARVSMRSNDAWLGLPYDLFQFISLQAAVASILGLPMGAYHHTVGSMHLYEKNVPTEPLVEVDNLPSRFTRRNWWTGPCVGDVVSMATAIGASPMPIGMSPFEQWLHSTLWSEWAEDVVG